MTRKDYKLIADVIASFRDPEVRLVLGATFVKRLSDAYPNFDSDKFARACEKQDK